MVYVGDHPLNDIDGARKAGCVPVWVKTTGVWDDEIATAPYEVDTVADIPALLAEIQTERG